MTKPHFYIKRGSVTKDLEADFPGLRYKSLTGLNNYGEVQMYTETFIEDGRPRVYFPQDVTRKQTELTLTLYFFGYEPERPRPEDMTDVQCVRAAQDYMRSFVTFVSGSVVTYWDTVRNRETECYLSGAVSVKEDRLYGHPYIQAEFKFKTLYGRSEEKK